MIMNTNKHSLFLLFVMLMTFLAGCATGTAPRDRPSHWAQPVPNVDVDNLYRVDTRLYRSAQPDEAGFEELYDLGIRYILNLRQHHDDRKRMGNLPFDYHHIRIDTTEMNYDQLVEGVAYLLQANGPVLVHCKHGSDRTGAMVAAYRIVANGWSKEQALDEFRNGGFGYHRFWFPNLTELIDSLDEDTLRRDVQKYRSATDPATISGFRIPDHSRRAASLVGRASARQRRPFRSTL